MNSTAAACAALLGVLLFGLGLAVSAFRFRSNAVDYHATAPDSFLARLVRAHANTSEYAPFLALLFLYLGSRHPTDSQIWLMVGATLCRLLIVIGLLAWADMGKANPARFVGAIGTYATGLALCFAVIRGA